MKSGALDELTVTTNGSQLAKYAQELADIGVRVIPATNELKLGVVTAFLGAPVLIALARRREAGGL